MLLEHFVIAIFYCFSHGHFGPDSKYAYELLCLVNLTTAEYNRSENCRKFVAANMRPHNWKLYSSRLQAESFSGRHWPVRQHTIS